MSAAMSRSSTASRDNLLVTQGAKAFGRVVSASTANLHRFGLLPGDDAVERVLDVPYTARGGKQSFDLYLPRHRDKLSEQPFVFFIHGGGWVIGDRKMGALMGRRLASQGIAVVAAGYRLSPAASLDEQRADISIALAHVLDAAPRYGLDASRYALMGESAGAHLAMRLLQEFPNLARPRAAIGMYGAYDLGLYRDLGSPVFDAFLRTVGQGADVDAFVNQHHAVRTLPFTDVPVLLVHGDADRFVPVQNSVSLARVLLSQGVAVDLRIYPGAGHGFNYQSLTLPHHTADSFRALEGFFERHVRDGTVSARIRSSTAPIEAP